VITYIAVTDAFLFIYTIYFYILGYCPTITSFLKEYVIFIAFGANVFISYKLTAENYFALEVSLNMNITSVNFLNELNKVVKRG
jgi:hypothetical protein